MIKNAPIVGWIARSAWLFAWELRGRPAPPPHIFKVRVLKEIAREYGLRTLVETGTYKGATIDALKGEFEELFSIELDEELHADAVQKYSGCRHVKLILGDSGEVLPRLVGELDSPALFWLDAHWSGGATARGDEDTPILRELDCVLSSTQRNAIVVDDLRLFGKDPGYPTVADVVHLVQERSGDLAGIEIKDDLLRIVPSK
jgi:hypothetical protein